MTLDDLQRRVLTVIAANRHPDSYFAGGSVINRSDGRISDDFDIFHARVETLAAALEADVKALTQHGYQVRPLIVTQTFHRAEIRSGGEAMLLDWAIDSDVRFFPVVPDAEFGWRLHILDLAIDKVLAAAGRREIRDAVDLLKVDRTILPLAAAVIAAPGRDPGLTPEFILGEVARNANWSAEEAHDVNQPVPPSTVDLNAALKQLARSAGAAIASVEPACLGRLWLDAEGHAVVPTREAVATASLHAHEPKPGGHWPSNPDIRARMLGLR